MKNWFLLALGSLVLIFLFLYSWYLPANHTRLLILDLRTNTERPGIVLSDTIKIEQSFVLQKNSNQITVPLQVTKYAGRGVMHIEIHRADKNAVVATEQSPIQDNQHGEVKFNLTHTFLTSGISYIANIFFTGVQEQDNIRLPYAFGKYSNLSGTVTQYQLKNGEWKQTDIRHGNIAMQFYSSPQESNIMLALKIFTLPAILVCAVFAGIIYILKKQKHQITVALIIHWKEYAIAACIGGLLSGVATIPLYIHPTYISNHGDINRGLVYQAIAYRDILTRHLPQWNQYICGGSPALGDLESWFLQPLFLLTLPFSAIIAMKFMLTLCLAITFLGFYVFTRKILEFEIWGSGIFAIIMAFGGYLSGHLAEGYYVWVASAWVPWFLLFALLSLKNSKWTGPAGLMLAFMFCSGSMHLVIFSLLFVAILFLFPIHEIKISRRYSAFILMTSFFLLLSAIKLLPAFSLLTANTSREGFAPSIFEFPHILFGRGVLPPLMSGEQTIRWAEFGAYIGYGVAILACIGAVLWYREIWKKYKPYIITSIFFLCVSFISIPITHGFVSHVTDLFRMPTRVIWFGIFFIALIAAYAIDRLVSFQHSSRDPRRFRIMSGMTICLIILVVVDLISNDMALFSRTFTVPLPELHQETTFQRVNHAYTTTDEAYYRAVYVDFLENRGTNDVCRFYQAGPFTLALDSTDPRTMYRGEVFLQNPDAGTISYTMNNQSRYSIHADITSPTTILVNQNYYAGWTTNSELEIQNAEGIIGIPAIPGHYNFSLQYEPPVVYWGILISMMGLLLGVLFLLYG